MLSLKLARSNLRKNLRAFEPFLMASITLFVLLFVVTSLKYSPSLSKLRGATALSQLLDFTFLVLAIFSVIILIYSYRFLQLNRAREFGLYDILGFGKAKVVAVAGWELVISYFITIVLGSVIGVIFSKFIFLIYVNLIGGNYFNLIISPIAVTTVSELYIVLFVILYFVSAVMIHRSTSLNLLKKASMGEKEPRSNIFTAGLAVIFLAAGYGIAVSVDNPITALIRFFIAVLLVIAGTYFFYLSFTIWYLKWRKKRDSYYQPENFITISSMLYRMKANATGLANITILLSMSLMTIIVTLSIFFGSQNQVKAQFPLNSMAMSSQPGISRAQLQDKVETLASQRGATLKNLAVIQQTQNVLVENKSSNSSTFVGGKYGVITKKSAADITMTTMDSLKSLGIDVPALDGQQVALYDFNTNTKKLTNIDWYGQNYQVKAHLSSVGKFPVPQTLSNSFLMVFNSEETLQTALSNYNRKVNSGEDSNNADIQTVAYFNIDKEDQKLLTKKSDAKETGQKDELTFAFLSDGLKDQRASVGGIVFIGFVLGISFILGAALIIYYKQLSEGEQDKRNFRILQEVGLSKTEVAKTIKTQVRTVFFLPIIVTVVHFAFAYNMISRIASIFDMQNPLEMITISVSAIAGLVVIYWIIYKVTSRVYYKIVER